MNDDYHNVKAGDLMIRPEDVRIPGTIEFILSVSGQNAPGTWVIWCDGKNKVRVCQIGAAFWKETWIKHG